MNICNTVYAFLKYTAAQYQQILSLEHDSHNHSLPLPNGSIEGVQAARLGSSSLLSFTNH